ncbi:hypothetical protein LOK49_LG12G01205 [Camellia lanceoleosa]|uniref:Uncharacterized protein n=1 Tax=Camellia lanceoleosa TaxID=1840588 RepID=A0ACC0FWX0_9ERIC|nr:hypothetical protein LOK49_LG12G01205 [Camellia lanceoleosa]
MEDFDHGGASSPLPLPPSLSLSMYICTQIFLYSCTLWYVLPLLLVSSVITIIGSVGEEEALLGVALVEPRRGGTWEGSSCWAVTLQDIGVYHRDAVYQTKSPRHAHMRFSGTWSVSSFPPIRNLKTMGGYFFSFHFHE